MGLAGMSCQARLAHLDGLSLFRTHKRLGINRGFSGSSWGATDW